jgi:hypothetical protein
VGRPWGGLSVGSYQCPVAILPCLLGMMGSVCWFRDWCGRAGKGCVDEFCLGFYGRLWVTISGSLVG